ncbi:hypothetical protein B9T62_29640 [Paenibacillus donghaensis]|uniref:Uncharacterized protein n=1 Tax=Paenibacillus donghaensis TaxID=414771 RepID=A0A2Z2KSI5_9BACL|nr:hypothetical protein B9T62_29640 [Paenibacillus donghaensis]
MYQPINAHLHELKQQGNICLLCSSIVLKSETSYSGGGTPVVLIGRLVGEHIAAQAESRRGRALIIVKYAAGMCYNETYCVQEWYADGANDSGSCL